MESVYRLLSKDVHSRLDRHHSVNRNCLFVGNGDCSHSCVGAVCEHQSVKADLPLLYLDLSWYATARPIVYCVFGLMNVGLVLEPFLAAVIVFALNEGAYGAETVRASLESVPSGQLEAGQCAGLSYLQTIFRIVLPQAMRTAFPSLFNALISMLKDTSLAATITVTEMFKVSQQIVARTYEPLLLYLEVGLIYLIFSTVLTKLQSIGEKKLSYYGRKEG